MIIYSYEDHRSSFDWVPETVWLHAFDDFLHVDSVCALEAGDEVSLGQAVVISLRTSGIHVQAGRNWKTAERKTHVSRLLGLEFGEGASEECEAEEEE